jgi:hypothetical protein
MKKLILTIMMLIIATTSSHALTYYFSGSDAGGTGSATMDITIVGDILTLTLDNTSPITLDGGSGVNTPGITGFGFNLDSILGVDSWELTAYATQSAVTTTIIGSSSDPSLAWDLGITQAGVTMDYLNHTKNVKGALYNPDATNGFAADPNYFTTAILTIDFSGVPVLDLTPDAIGSGLTGSTYVRFMNVGLNGEGSLKLTPVPEPGTMVLLGVGLLGLAIYGKRRKNNTEAK